MRNKLRERFALHRYQTTWKQELLAGLTSFFTIAYIIVINAAILADAGIPMQAGIIATALTAFVGCMLMGWWANAPIVLVPGMGVNAFFSYTVVQSMHLTWQEALTVVFLSGLLFTIVAFTRLVDWLSEAVPSSLNAGISVGIGLFLTLIGLQKGGIVTANDYSMIAMGNLAEPRVIVTLITLLLTVILMIRGVRGNFLIGILAGSALASVWGLIERSGDTDVTLQTYWKVVGTLTTDGWDRLPFWIATFSLTLILVFENMGLLHGMLPRKEQFRRSFQANAISAMTAGLLGTSSTVSTVESAAGIAAGGRTGITAITTGVLFLLSLLFLPWMQWIPPSAVAPVLIVLGGLMLGNVRRIPWDDMSEWFPAYLIAAAIPLTYSIADGMAFGFIAYPVLKIAKGQAKSVPIPLYIIAGLFLLSFLLRIWM
ncbi:NCS2 family permease [Polycladomyces sp. WAk]|uniref:NCS2 family permease n=1 Tax=Polycladomyces zharkentensis TaxID=2807616 RepID=A0ABS2WJF3_9BACL|nr:NCS2 family permease [Polycladomyces sp. WAk]MBN2909648.1 NCS2 family permease [Polycladomyces sp. WAk]